MRRLFLLRHGEPAFPHQGERLCLGRTDLPLSPLGRMQACLAAWELRGEERDVFTSPLRRARETAAFFSPAPAVLEGLAEADMGAWDGLSFSRIKERWPELYARRGRDLTLPPPGGETPERARERFAGAVQTALDSAPGDLVLVSHAQVAELFCSSVLHRTYEELRRVRLGYGSLTVLQTDGTQFFWEKVFVPSPALCPALCLRLLDAARAGERVKAHCQAVAAQALMIAQALPLELNTALLENAALLHDIARCQPAHEAVGARWLRTLGYEAEADLVEKHRDWPGGPVDEGAVLFLADKCVQETVPVSLEARFAASGAKCRTAEAKAAHERRYAAAREVKENINRLCHREIIR